MQTTVDDHTAKALVLEIQRMSTEDGPGIRTTVFFKGCSLKCDWCHNPESISSRSQIQWIGSRCIGCETCVATCPNKALTLTAEGLYRDMNLCRTCGLCTEECPSTAMESIGQKWALPDLIAEVIKDKAYYETSGGGVTVSGGDPLLQYRFVSEFLKGLKGKGIQTALDTCGLCHREVLATVLPYADMVLYDIKMANPTMHRQHTGVSNERILENLAFVRDFMGSHIRPNRLWVRTPIIPGATATSQNIQAIGKLILELLGDRVDRWELCAFNNLCRDKYLRLDLDWPYKGQELLSKAFMEDITETARQSGVNPEIVHWSGSTRSADDDDGQEMEDRVLKIAPHKN